MRNKADKPQSFAEIAEELRQAWREFIVTLAVWLRIDRAAYWIAAKMTKEDGE